ncbi:LuxR C-terminal-related transcriptional regulator [Patulibacter sp.]|uniref:LuxR C-terminal-related transcriptional regulator n=1 Tax=Patulibacter sp. TaxID=1912859 RepID=UPI00272763D9|nr:LuxR C-terminal-related transcriptional regulator [Patulibacter sp.]MDO9409320.1 LuxR C-terminal-related transcriptional regulator [Patulibacter sp.]
MLTRATASGRQRGPVLPLRDPVLRGAVTDIIHRVDRALELPSVNGSARTVLEDGEAVRAELAVRLVRLAERLREPASRDRWATTQDQLVDLLLDVRSISDRVENELDGRWASLFSRLRDAVATVRRASRLDELIADTPTAVCGLGFRRVLLSSVEEGTFVARHALDLDDPSREAVIVHAGSDRPLLLDRDLRETDMVRTREPVVVTDAQGDPRGHPGLLRATGWTSYVAAPVTVRDGEVIGFIHADRGAAPVGTIDAEALRLYAEAYGMAFERLAVEHRTERARDRVRRAVAAMESVFESGGGDAGARPGGDPRPEIEALLTSRETEVLRLMATGATNAAIAARLVIAEGTAKTHVKNILRKLDAGNRAEAVSRFLGGVDDGDDAA